MTEREQNLLKNFIEDRLEVSFQQLLADDEAYQACSRQLAASEDAAGEAIDRLSEEERQAVCRHFEEDAAALTDLEMNAAYMQGMRDCVQLLAQLGALS